MKIYSRLCEKGAKDEWHEESGNLEEVAQKFINTYSMDNRTIDLSEYCYLGCPEVNCKPLKVWRQMLTSTLYVELKAE